jgi:glutamine amidotransferase
MIALVDYGIGNLRSVEKALQAVGGKICLTDRAETILAAEKVVLPGVGAFGDGMEGLQQRGLVEPLIEAVCQGKPLLGICLGMQLLFESSEERGHHRGLGLLPGSVRRFPDAGLKIPQTGWNQINFRVVSGLLSCIESGSYAYFNHSYYCEPLSSSHVLATTDYVLPYACIVGEGNLFGVQFHPEKSQAVGLRILRNFVELGK